MMTIVRTSFALQIINCHILNPYQCSSFREIDLFIAVFIFDTVYLYCILVSKASIFYWEDGLRMISVMYVSLALAAQMNVWEQLCSCTLGRAAGSQLLYSICRCCLFQLRRKHTLSHSLHFFMSFFFNWSLTKDTMASIKASKTQINIILCCWWGYTDYSRSYGELQPIAIYWKSQSTAPPLETWWLGQRWTLYTPNLWHQVSLLNCVNLWEWWDGTKLLYIVHRDKVIGIVTFKTICH